MKTLTVNSKKITITQLVEKIQSKLNDVSEGFSSQYISVEIEDENTGDYETFKIRVSDHSARKQNNGDVKTLSFITDTCDQGYSSMMFNEYVVENIQEMHTNETNYKGWLTVEDIITDFVEDFKF